MQATRDSKATQNDCTRDLYAAKIDVVVTATDNARSRVPLNCK